MDVAQRLTALSRSYLFAGLPREELEPLARAAAVRRLVAGEPLWQIGDGADELYVILDGEVKDSVISVDGDEVVHFVHSGGMTVGEPGYFSRERTRIVRVVATTPATALRVERSALEPILARRPDVLRRATERLAANSRWQTNLLSAALTRPLVDRLVLRLLELADTQPGERVLRTPPVSQSLLAAMVGVSRENVNRALATLVGKGWVRRVDGCYELLDEAALRTNAERDWHPVVLRDGGWSNPDM